MGEFDGNFFSWNSFSLLFELNLIDSLVDWCEFVRTNFFFFAPNIPWSFVYFLVFQEH